MGKKLDLTGQRFGRLVVIEKVGKNKSGNILWQCICDCGNIKTVIGGNLNSGDTKSCGCLSKELCTTHGKSDTKTYKTWEHMLQRCNNPNEPAYKHYGGRGITVCDKWLKFEGFLEDMGERLSGLSIDRKENDKGYFKDNCRWVTQTTQMRNTRIYKTNTTGVKGVWWCKKRKRYVAEIIADYKKHHIGRYKTLELAAIARKEAELKYWGEKT